MTSKKNNRQGKGEHQRQRLPEKELQFNPGQFQQ